MKLSTKSLPALALAAMMLPGAALADRAPFTRFLAEIVNADARGSSALRDWRSDDGHRRGHRTWSHDNDDDDDRGGRRGRDDDDDDGRNDNDDDD